MQKPVFAVKGLAAADDFSSTAAAPADDVADATVNPLLRVVPATAPGIAFLSGGRTAQLATARLNAIDQRYIT